jgi:hypothetical protein
MVQTAVLPEGTMAALRESVDKFRKRQLAAGSGLVYRIFHIMVRNSIFET